MSLLFWAIVAIVTSLSLSATFYHVSYNLKSKIRTFGHLAVSWVSGASLAMRWCHKHYWPIFSPVTLYFNRGGARNVKKEVLTSLLTCHCHQCDSWIAIFTVVDSCLIVHFQESCCDWPAQPSNFKGKKAFFGGIYCLLFQNCFRSSILGVSKSLSIWCHLETVICQR